MRGMWQTIARASLIVFTSCAAFGQLAFEVASVKPNNSESKDSTWNDGHAKVSMTNVTLRTCIQAAYGVKNSQIEGPGWLEFAKYDIFAKAPEGTPDEQLGPMMQTLLAERFKLVLHRETKERLSFTLVVGKNGIKLHEVEAGQSNTRTTRGRLTAHKTSMQQLANNLSYILDQPVLDMTGVTGVFDFTLDFVPEQSAAADAPSGPSIFAALQEQLGLKLEPKKVPTEILVVDHAEKVPSEN